MEQIISAHFSSHGSAESAVRALGEAGVPMKHVSIVAQNLQTSEQVQGFINKGVLMTSEQQCIAINARASTGVGAR